MRCIGNGESDQVGVCAQKKFSIGRPTASQMGRIERERPAATRIDTHARHAKQALWRLILTYIEGRRMLGRKRERVSGQNDA